MVCIARRVAMSTIAARSAVGAGVAATKITSTSLT